MKAQNRSRVTNGSKLVAGVDGRTKTARRYKDLVASFSADLGTLNEGQRAIVAQAAALTVQSERLNGAMLRGEMADIEQIVRCANVLSRSLKQIRAWASAKPKTTMMADYLAKLEAAKNEGSK
jgi:hypothetical protein